MILMLNIKNSQLLTFEAPPRSYLVVGRIDPGVSYHPGEHGKPTLAGLDTLGIRFLGRAGWWDQAQHGPHRDKPQYLHVSLLNHFPTPSKSGRILPMILP